jgi:hypothetical protein
MVRRISLLVVASLVALALLASTAIAAPLPDNCTKEQGTVTCSTFEGPGNNQAGVGTTTTTQGQGNPENTSPEPQELEDTCNANPPSSQGNPNQC